MPNARSRFTKHPPPTASPAPPSQRPAVRPQTRAGFGFGFKPSTPQPPPALRPGFPAFKTPQLGQGAFAQRHQTSLPRPEREDQGEPEGAMPRSHLPRPARRSEPDHEQDSGSELERRVNPGLGRLVVANAQIVPSSSEESAQEERGRPQSMWAHEGRRGAGASAFQALARKTATRVPSPQRRPNLRPRPQPELHHDRRRREATTDARPGAHPRRDSRASIGLGLDMDPRMEMSGRYHPGESRDDDAESVYDDDGESEEGADGNDGEHIGPQYSQYEDTRSRHATVPESSNRRRSDVQQDLDTSIDRRKRLSGIVDGLQATYDTHRSPGKSILSQSESDVYYEQGLAIGTSSDIPNSSMGDVSLRDRLRDGVGGDEDGDEEQSNYSESEDSFSIVVDEETEQVQPERPWWMRGRRSPTTLGGVVEGGREPEVEVTALRRLSGTSSKRTPRNEERVNARTSTGDLLLLFGVVSVSHYLRQTLGSELPVRPANLQKGLRERVHAEFARRRTRTPLEVLLQRTLEGDAVRLCLLQEITPHPRIQRNHLRRGVLGIHLRTRITHDGRQCPSRSVSCASRALADLPFSKTTPTGLRVCLVKRTLSSLHQPTIPTRLLPRTTARTANVRLMVYRAPCRSAPGTLQATLSQAAVRPRVGRARSCAARAMSLCLGDRRL